MFCDTQGLFFNGTISMFFYEYNILYTCTLQRAKICLKVKVRIL